MTSDEFKNIRKNLTLTEDGASKYGVPPSSKVSQNLLSRILGVKNDRTIRKWEEGESILPARATLAKKLISTEKTIGLIIFRKNALLFFAVAA